MFVFSLLFRCQIASAHKHSKYKHKNNEGSGDGEDDDRSKTFITEARMLKPAPGNYLQSLKQACNNILLKSHFLLHWLVQTEENLLIVLVAGWGRRYPLREIKE